MEIVDILLEKLRQGTASESEKRQLLAVLSEKELELKEVLEQDFTNYVETQVQVISPDRSAELLLQIQQKTTVSDASKAPKGKLFRLPGTSWKWLAAACIAGILAVGVLYLQLRPATAGRSELAADNKPQLKTISNTFPGSLSTTLPDGSVVTLEPGSALSFYQPFDGAKRDLSLTGKALFKVSKDASKPFTVYANGIATTALGTEFWVDARLDSISVKLLEGKVVVRSVNNNITMKAVFLKPGEQLSLNRQTGVYAVSDFITGPGSAQPVNRRTVNRVALAFNKTPLAGVFEQIGRKYNVEVQYNASELQSLSFTGTFLVNDSLQTILTIICNTNDLSFKQTPGVVVINK